MRVLVIGGGIGGMATAIALAQAGLEPLVLEQSNKLTEIGSGIGMSPNALRVLEQLGAADRVRESGVRIDYVEWRRMDDDELIYSQPLADMKDVYGDVYIAMHRADLLGALAEQVPAEHVRLGAKLVGLEERADRVLARLDTGEEIEGDLMVGADGLRSTVREILFGKQPARFTGIAAWRGLVTSKDLPAGFDHKIITWPGVGRHGMTYPIRPGLVAFNGFVPAAEVHREEWGPSGNIDDLLTSLRGAARSMMQILALIKTALITPIYFRDPLPTWGTQRITLLGDAAHPAPPSAGQGAAMALEDAVTLAACLRRADGVPAALSEFAARRQARTAAMLTASRINLSLFNEPDPVQQRARDGRTKGMLKLDPASETMFGWLYGHDAVAAAQQPLVSRDDHVRIMRRPDAQRAFEAWKGALTQEDRSRLWLGEREGYERFLERTFPHPAEVSVEQIVCDGVRCLKVIPPGVGTGAALLHLHGGGFTMGSASGAVDLAARLARAVGGWALVPDYRLAPEHAFPAALDDVTLAYRWLARQDAGARLLVSGEGAGGGLAVSLALRGRETGERMPDRLHVVSPFVDLTLSSESSNASPVTDPWLDRNRLRLLAASYIQDGDPADPLLSPAGADLHGLPPLLIQAAAGEALADDAVLLARAAERDGVEVTLRVVEDSVHSFVLFPFLPETGSAIQQLAEHCATARVSST